MARVDQNKRHPEKTLHHLRTHGSITPMEAWTAFGCYRLSSVIQRLRKKGYLIETKMNRDSEGKQYARYKYHGVKTAAGRPSDSIQQTMELA